MSAPSAELRDLLALHLTPGVGPRTAAALLEWFGSAAAVLRASEARLRDVPHVGPKLAQAVREAAANPEIDAELERVAKGQVRLLLKGTPDYPESIASISDPPLLLYVRGELTPADAVAVALVGSRHCTDAGRRTAAKLAAGLGRAGVTVISGLARGIDGIAHRAALEAGGRTVAVLAGGLSRIYPPEHRSLAEQVVGAGALLTESSMTQEPLAGLFPPRNRLISGLSRVVVIVEAGVDSGALHTAHHAAEQGRTVLAVPGPVDAETSAGCNALIRDGAVLCRGPDDVLEELHGVSAVSQSAKAAAPAPTEKATPPGLTDEQRRVWEFLAGGVRTVDELAQNLGMTAPQLTGALMMMEMKRAIRRLPGNRYERR
ncbi:MAG TPA: DNA-processing protein DprA [Gemmataceae bacterium]|nr:DNA-processing protein DprA [Gemmataceae bacterium]